MSLLHDDHRIDKIKPIGSVKGLACWEYLDCNRILCPVHGRKETDCWLVPKTLCGPYILDDFIQKLSACLICTYFSGRGIAYTEGWNRFLAEQLHRYNFKALEQIYQKEESFIEILNRIPDGLFTTDQEWRITYFNPAAEKITGFSAHDAVGMYCRDVFKNSICEVDCALRRAVAEGCDIHNREYVITNIEGKKIPIMCSTSAFLDNSGKIAGGLEIFKDITELKQLQEEIASRERKFRRVFEGSHDMVYRSNLRGEILDVNQAGLEMLGYGSKEELLSIGSALRLYRNTQDRIRFLKMINREGYVKDFEVDFVKKDGTPIHVLISSRKYENEQNGGMEFEGIIKDITERKRTEQALIQRNRELSILNSIAVAVNLNKDLDHILDITLTGILKVLDLRRGAIFLFDRESKKAILHVKKRLPDINHEKWNNIIFKDELLKKYLIEEGVRLSPEPTFPTFQVKYLSDSDVNIPWLSCFLITFKGLGTGFFALDIPSTRILGRQELNLLGSLGNFLGGTIENAQLKDTIRRHRHELRHLTEKLFQNQEEERRRIARELHDEAGQSLTAVKLGLDRLEEKIKKGAVNIDEEIAEIRKMVIRTSTEMRQLSYRLHPTLLSDLGLEPALHLYFKEIMNHSDLDIEFDMIGFDHRLDRETETVLYRFSQESLTNTLKHSGAELFRLTIIKSYPKIIFLAVDDGIGFDGHIGGGDKMSLGLIGMRERTSLLGGTFHLRSVPGRGTRIRIEIPTREMQESWENLSQY